MVSTLKSNVETMLKKGCFPDAEINNVVSMLKIGCSTSQPKINLKTTLCADWDVFLRHEITFICQKISNKMQVYLLTLKKLFVSFFAGYIYHTQHQR